MEPESTIHGAPDAHPTVRPIALVYRGPASAEGCPEAVAEMLAASRWNFDVQYAGPRERRTLSAEGMADAVLYVQPGGGRLRSAHRHLRDDETTIRAYVGAGGRYVGFSLGGYLAGRSPGFGLLPGEAERYVSSPDAELTDTEASLVEVAWEGRPRRVYFEDGPWFHLEPVHGPAEVVAVYSNGLPAAVVAPYALGVVGVAGPHVEAPREWYVDAGLVAPDLPTVDLGLDLVDRVMIHAPHLAT